MCVVLAQWLVDFSKAAIVASPRATTSCSPNILHTRFAELQPYSYDPLRLKEVKLLAILHCFSATASADDVPPFSCSG